ncbi:MAG: hypothetical protein ABIQ27_07700 [Flavobacterium sp.]|uniref:hypothetical protein n=1 Tax=Flavobacterium sp. TaxID=239 RepID=UPI0032641681
MTRILTTILLITFGLTSFGQIISVDTLFIPRTEKFSNAQNEKLKFPVIKTSNLQVDKVINTDLKNRFTNNEYPDLTTDSTLIKWADGIIYLDFQVTYIKNGLISFNISAEGCGAYCTSWSDYYTYNYLTGQFVTIDQVIDTAGHFKNQVISDKNRQYEQQKKELKEMLLDKNAELDEETYNWALEQYENCQKEFTLNSFALYSDYLEIIEKCYLPNAIKNLTPTIELKYKYIDIKKDLKIKN